MNEASGSDLRELLRRLEQKQHGGLSRAIVLVVALSIGFLLVVVISYRLISTRLSDVEIWTKVVNIERILLKDNNYAWAISQYEQIAKGYKSAAIQARLGRLYFGLDPKNEKIALEHLALAKKIDPSYWETYTNLVYIYVVNGRAADALREGKRALELNDLDAATYNNLAWLHATSKDPSVHNLQLAEEYAKKAVQLSLEKQPAYLDTLAEVYYQRGGEANHVLALRYMRKAMTLAPRDQREAYNEHFRQLFPKEKL